MDLFPCRERSKEATKTSSISGANTKAILFSDRDAPQPTARRSKTNKNKRAIRRWAFGSEVCGTERVLGYDSDSRGFSTRHCQALMDREYRPRNIQARVRVGVFPQHPLRGTRSMRVANQRTEEADLSKSLSISDDRRSPKNGLTQSMSEASRTDSAR